MTARPLLDFDFVLKTFPNNFKLNLCIEGGFLALLIAETI